MNTLKLIVTEVLGLFIDDGSFALVILGVVAAVGIAAHLIPDQPALTGGLLMIGCLAVLAESTLRAGRK